MAAVMVVTSKSAAKHGQRDARPVKHEKRYLTHGQVEDLANATCYPAAPNKHSNLDTRTNEMYRIVVLFLAYTGIRFGEMAAPRVRRLDLPRRRAVITESVTLRPGQRPGVGDVSPGLVMWSTSTPRSSMMDPTTTTREGLSVLGAT
jgi:integrase